MLNISLCQNVLPNTSLLVVEEGTIRMNIKKEKLVFRHDVRNALHVGIAVRGRAEEDLAVKEIRAHGIVANLRNGRRGLSLMFLCDLEYPYYRKCGYLRRMCWKDRCRKVHQWEKHLRRDEAG